MQNGKDKNPKETIGERVQRLMDLAELEIDGFAEYLSISPSHLYAILNGNRDLTVDIADKVGSAFDLKGSQILRINYRIPKRIKKSESLNKFYEENKNVESYFIKTRGERKDSYYIEHDLFNSNLFDSPIYIWELKEYCQKAGKNYTSKRLSQILNYMVDRKKLKKKKRPLKLRNGKYGKRKVDVFFK
jgi:plasmid maintenance system antidote protein VapI